MLMETEKGIVEDAAHIETQIRGLDAKISEIMEAVKRLSDEESKLLEKRSKRRLGDIDDIVVQSREDQKRLQELRDAIEIEQAPLLELKSRKDDCLRQYNALRQNKTRTMIKEILDKVDQMHRELSSLKSSLEEMEEIL